MDALIFANGALDDGIMVRRALASLYRPLVIAADGGARMAQDPYGCLPHVVIGDLDSLDPEEVQALERQYVQIIKHPPEKDETDLELAFRWAVNANATRIRVVGALGRRLDQTFANVYLLALPELRERDVRLVSGNQEIWLIAEGTHTILGEAGDTLSLIPLTGSVKGISTQNLYYPLHQEMLVFGPARGISNVLTTHHASVTVTDGTLLVVHTVGRAE